MHSNRNDRGQAVVLLLAVVVMTALAVWLSARLVSASSIEAGLRRRPTAAALAAVLGGRAAAARLAGDNGGQLVSFDQDGDVVTVVVDVDGERATARATDGP